MLTRSHVSDARQGVNSIVCTVNDCCQDQKGVSDIVIL